MTVKEIHTSADLAAILKVTRQAIEKRACKEHWPVVQLNGRAGAYPYETLPPDVKAAIARHEAAQVPQKVLGNAVIPDWSHRIGLARFQVVSEWRAYCQKQKARGVKKAEATETFLTAYNSGLLCKKAFEVIGAVRKSSIYSWDLTLRENGDDYYQICDKRGKWRQGGKKGLGQLSPEAQDAFLSAWLKPNQLSVTMAYKVMAAVLGKNEMEAPSLSTVYRFAQRYEDLHYNIYVLKRQGEKALNDKVLPYIKRDSNILEVGDVLFADGHTLNFECLHPETGKPFRPTLILWFDWKSAMPVGWEIMPTENTVAISSALYMAIIRLGKYPKIAYLDNGRAFKSKFFTEKADDLEMLSGLYARLGIGLQLAKPYHGQSKVVERFFGTFNEQCARLMPSYTGRDITDKPAWRGRNEKYHQKLHERRAGIPTLRQAMQVFESYVHWYASAPHARIAGQSHGEVFAAGQGPGIDPAELRRHFLWSKKVKPRNCQITLNKVEYTSDKLLNVHCEIVAKYSWADLSVVHLYDQDGDFLGDAYPKELVHPVAARLGDEHDQAMVADHNRRYASLKKETMRQARRLDGDLREQPGLMALPYVERACAAGEEAAALLEAEPVYDLSDEERARLETIYENAISDMAAGPKIERPPFFQSEFDKYDWLFEAAREGYQPTAEDMAFMAKYEASEEYQCSTGARYEQLRAQEHYWHSQAKEVRQ